MAHCHLPVNIPRLQVVEVLNIVREPCKKHPIQPDTVQILYRVKKNLKMNKRLASVAPNL
jgi:hypothetical protein